MNKQQSASDVAFAMSAILECPCKLESGKISDIANFVSSLSGEYREEDNYQVVIEC